MSIHKHPDNAFHLYRPTMGDGQRAAFNRLRCQCEEEEDLGPILEVDLDDTGQWSVTCPYCGEASMLSDLMKLKPEA